MSAETRLAELELQLPPAPKPAGLYKTLVVIGEMAYVSGHGPLLPDGSFITGRIGAEMDEDSGYEAAQQTGLAILATLRAELGSLDRVRRVVKLFGMVNCTPQFDRQPTVINGCSQLFADVFRPEAGIAARSAVGVGSLPLGMPVEIEAVFQIN